MQMKLSQIAMIPILIQSTLETVSKTVDQFTSATDKQREQHALLEENVDVQSNDDENLTGNEFGCSSEEKTIDIQTSVASEIVSADKYDYDFEDDLSTNLSEVVFTPPPSPDLQLTDEQANKSGQQLKMQEMERSWPWKDEEKIIQKRSTCHLVPGSNMIQNRIKQLNEGQIMAFYNRN